ncbi:MAG: SAM-dependent methyltransferase [Pseudomonadota bacterium]
MHDRLAALPSVPPALAAHADKVRQHLSERIAAAGGALPFSDFMQSALYAPGLGYYSGGAQKFGEDGDFTTAPEISPAFGAVLARQCQAVLAQLGHGDIVEYGAGTGRLAADVLGTLAELRSLPDAYYIVEVSADLRARQRDTLAATIPVLLERVHWIDDPREQPVRGIVIANEVLDALCVERFRIGANSDVERQFVCLIDGALATEWRTADAALAAAVAQIQASLGRSLPEGYISEVCLQMPAWLQMVAETLQRGVILMSDYGYGRDALYAPDRSSGTLTCHYRHHAHDDVLHLPGCEDITAWVDFTNVAESLDAAGLNYLGFTTQAQFLLNGGLTEVVSAAADDALALSRGIKTLTLPGEMGERFKFIGFSRECDVLLPGFSGRDFGVAL